MCVRFVEKIPRCVPPVVLVTRFQNQNLQLIQRQPSWPIRDHLTCGGRCCLLLGVTKDYNFYNHNTPQEQLTAAASLTACQLLKGVVKSGFPADVTHADMVVLVQLPFLSRLHLLIHKWCFLIKKRKNLQPTNLQMMW